VGLAREEAKNLGMPDLPLVIITHPIGGEALTVIHQRAEDALAQVIRALTGDA
jgi:predicted alpha/beta hydrolase